MNATPPGPFEGTFARGPLWAPYDALNDVVRVRHALESLVELLGMRTLYRLVFDVHVRIAELGGEPFADEGGVTGIVVLSTSHLAIHTWPAQGAAQYDLYSCRPFDAEAAARHLGELMGATRCEVVDLSYALNPHDVGAARVI